MIVDTHRPQRLVLTAATAALTAILMTGCGESPPDSPATSNSPQAGAELTTVSSNGERDGVIRVAVTEGTNLSFGLSSDGSRIAMSVQGVLFTMPAEGGTATAITDYYQDAREPTWSPDDTSIAYYGYHEGNWDLWSIPATGGEPAQLTSGPFDDREPQYSPDGTRIAFSSDRNGKYDIWILHIDDGRLTQATNAPADEYSPTWAADGQHLAYARTKGRAASELYLLNLADSASRLLIAEQGAISGVSWQPRTQRLSYQLRDAKSTSLKSITAASAKATLNSKVFSQHDDDVFPVKAQWDENARVLYAANGKIYAQPLPAASATARQALPFLVEFELQRPAYQRKQRDHDSHSPRRALGLSTPVLSPDGAQVSFAALGDIWIWHPADNALTNITNSPYVARTPSWSPQGQQIAYISDKPAKAGAASAPGLWVYNIDQKKSQPIPVQANGVSGPSWSPDGGSIALFTAIPTNPLGGQMVIANLRSGAITPVHTPVPAQPISWSVDGSYLATTVLAPYSRRFREGVYQLVVTATDGKEQFEIEPVAHKNMTNAALSPTGQAMSYVQDGLLWQQQLNKSFEPQGEPIALTNTLADSPAWSGNGRYVVYMNAEKMMKLDVTTGVATNITPSVTWTPFQPKRTWTLLVGKLFDGVSDEYQENVLVTIEGNRIQAMEPNATSRAADVDASDKAAFPGLFEMHAHLGENSESQGRTWLAYGITSVRDPGAHPYVAKERQEMWSSGKSIGPRTYTTGFLTDGNRVYYSVAEGITSATHLERALDRAQRLELDFIKTYVRLPDHWQRRVVEFAHDIGIPTSSHELFPAVAHGMDHVEHIGGTSRRGYAPKVSSLGRSYNDVVNLLAASGMGITPTAVLPGYAVIVKDQPDLFATPQFDTFYGSAGRQAAAVISQMFGASASATTSANGQLLRDLNAADALMVSGTDSPFSPYGAGLHAELRLYELAGLTPTEVLRTATVKAAIAAGVAQDLGSLQVGMIADMVVVDGDPLADIADADNVVMTVKNGRAYPLKELLQPPQSNQINPQ